ncbi:hypothetical protein [Actinoplanes sp. DH11]|uniref:hypothetical protein n=1 Tax=Actinoplanes sp. DH11 TaxID=2857011 RepID=UPI001E2AB9BF|nr:hypothetical protein [Actinoplanes sp. DH11]
MTPARPRSARIWKRRVRHAGTRVFAVVEDWTAPGGRPPRSESEVSTLVAAVTLAAGGLFLLIMLVTWLTRS